MFLFRPFCKAVFQYVVLHSLLTSASVKILHIVYRSLWYACAFDGSMLVTWYK